MPESFFIDMHCHPSLKPFGRSFPGNINSSGTRRKSSIWHQKTPNPLTKVLNKALTVTRFTQSDFKTLVRGKVKIVCASLYPVERGFLISKLGQGAVADVISDWIIGIGKPKVDFVQENADYFSELEEEMKFFEQLNDTIFRVGLNSWKYRLAANYNEILENIQSEENIVSVIPSIEGAHVFISDNRTTPDTKQVMLNIDQMLQWKYKPFFLSPAHHFYNHLCGHAYSLSKGLRVILDQKTGVNTGITPLGWKVIEKLLANRVYIDIKHMSRQSRREYYRLLSKPEYKDIPLIVSHGAVNGHPSVKSDEEHDEENGKFHGSDINFYDDELVLLAQSKGLFCIQLDERRIVSKGERLRTNKIMLPARKLEARAGFVWNQIAHIARLLDREQLHAWDSMCIGSDYDGIVDPLNGFWTAMEIRKLRSYLLKCAGNFLNSPNLRFKNSANNISPEKIIDKIFYENALTFIRNFYY